MLLQNVFFTLIFSSIYSLTNSFTVLNSISRSSLISQSKCCGNMNEIVASNHFLLSKRNNLAKERIQKDHGDQLQLKFAKKISFRDLLSECSDIDYIMKTFQTFYPNPLPTTQRHMIMKTLISTFVDLRSSEQSFSLIHAVGLVAQIRAILENNSEVYETCVLLAYGLISASF